jgi:hypothetical protein
MREQALEISSNYDWKRCEGRFARLVEELTIYGQDQRRK